MAQPSSKSGATPHGQAQARPVKTKIIVRRLPHNLPKESFFKAIEEYQSFISYNYYVPGKATSKREIDSRAYLTFTTREMVVKFHGQFQNHVFVDAKGKSHSCSIEYAPYQNTPEKPPKHDPTINTIEADPDYIRFLENIRNPSFSEATQKSDIIDDPDAQAEEPESDGEPVKKSNSKTQTKSSPQAKAPHPKTNSPHGNQPHRVQPIQGGVPPSKNAPKKKAYAYRGVHSVPDQPNNAGSQHSNTQSDPNINPKNPNHYRKTPEGGRGRGRGAPKYQQRGQQPQGQQPQGHH